MSDYLPVEPVIQSRLWDVLRTMRQIVGDGLAAASPAISDPIMVLVGYPTWTEGAKVWGQPVDPGFVTIDALPSIIRMTKYTPQWGVMYPIYPGFTGVTTSNSLTVNTAPSGAVAGTNVHTIFKVGNFLFDAHYQTQANDTPTLVAAGVANALNNAAPSGSGARASSLNNVMTCSGCYLVKTNFAGVGEAHMEVGRIARMIQVSVWVSSPWARFQVEDVIVSTLGAIDNAWMQLPDGGWALVKLVGERFNEQSQLSYNLYEAHMTFSVEYAIIQRAPAYAIGAIELAIEAEESELMVNKLIY